MKRIVLFGITLLAWNLNGQFSGGTGTLGDPYQIANLTDLQAMDNSSYASSHFILTAHIDASPTSTWNSGAGFDPIDAMNGSLNGAGYTISDLFINRTGSDKIGMIGQSNGTISNLGLIDVNVTAGTPKWQHGGLVGLALGGSISNCFVTGQVNGGARLGLLVGFTNKPITNCYTIGSVSGTKNVGGLVGFSDWGSHLTNNYASTSVTSTMGPEGAIAGFTHNGVTYSNNYVNSDVETGGPAVSASYNTSGMKDESNFIGFDFTSSWGISSFVNSGYPYLLGVVAQQGNIWDGSSWSQGNPSSSDIVTISSNTTPSSFTAGDVLIQSGVELNTTGINVTIHGDVANPGSGFTGDGQINFAGTSALSGRVISHDGVVNVTGTLTTNDLLIVNATSPTAYGMLTGTGTVTGDVTVEQYVDLPTPVGIVDGRWIEIAANVTAAIADWNEGQTMVAANTSQGTVWQYNASSGAWGAPADINSNAELGRGYSVYAGTNNFGTFLRSGDGTIDLAGAANTTDVPITLQYNAGSSTFDTEGWNLIGNPFAAQYDWAQQTIPAGLNDAIYIWDGQLDRYATYVGTTGNNGGTQYIAPGQGFWVKTTTGPISFTFAANNRVTSESTTLFKTTSDIIRLKAGEEGATIQDELIVGFDASASHNFDGSLDAQKRYNGSSVPNFFSVISGIDYAINRIPANGTSDSIPLALQYAPQGVKMEITANTQDLLAYTYVELRDAKTGQAIDLKSQPTYQFANDTNMVEGRFSLHFDNHNVSLEENHVSNANWFAYQGDDNLMVSFDKKLIGEALVIHNISGIQIAEIEISQSDIAILQSQPRGVYLLRLKGNQSQVQKVVQQ